MKLFYKRVLDGVRQSSPLLSFTERGMSPREVKQSIVDLLSPYFDNQGILNELAVEILAPEAVNVSKIENDPWAKAMFSNVPNEYRQAMAYDKDACLDGCAGSESKVQQGLSEYWSGFHLEVDKGELPLEEFKYEAFRNIGMVIEASLQPLLRDLLLQVRLRSRKANPEVGLQTLDLGLVVSELFDTSGYPELFAPPPWGIRLNQWRNMAQHHKTRVEKGLVIGTYGKGSTGREVRFRRQELLHALTRIFSIFIIIKTARSVFLVDNINELHEPSEDLDVRAEAKLVALASSVATQGFELIDICIDKESVTAVVRDVMGSNIKERMLHCSQFVYPVWTYFAADAVTVRYLDSQGDLVLTTTGRGSDCKELARAVIPVEEFANRVTLTLSDKGRSYFAKAST